MNGATAPLRRWAPLLLLLVSCSSAGGEPVAVSEPAAPGPLVQDVERPATERLAEQSSEHQSEQQAQLVRDIADARIAAYDARAAAFGLRRVGAARRAASARPSSRRSTCSRATRSAARSRALASSNIPSPRQIGDFEAAAPLRSRVAPRPWR